MCNSVIFSKKKIEDINKYIQDNIDSRLYLFAYYNPKAKGNKSAELDFWKGITNVYGLFQDCAAFIKRDKNSLLDVFVTYGALQENDANKLREFINIINAFRAMFSHNVCMEYSTDANNMRLCQSLFSKTLQQEIVINDINEIALQEKQWEIVLGVLFDEAEQSIHILYEALQEVSKSAQKDAIVKVWINLILEWYERKFDDLLYRATYNQFMLYCTLHLKSRRIYDKRMPVKEWIRCKGASIREKMNDIYNKDKLCILPLEFFNALIMEIKPYEFWDDYYKSK
ncbi:MAG: hypothetical protein PUF03_06035 [Lachnospiraceae bacterium]|nr:hypothetical protein [Lachnospiraceae bacterium]